MANTIFFEKKNLFDSFRKKIRVWSDKGIFVKYINASKTPKMGIKTNLWDMKTHKRGMRAHFWCLNILKNGSQSPFLVAKDLKNGSKNQFLVSKHPKNGPHNHFWGFKLQTLVPELILGLQIPPNMDTRANVGV